MGSQERGVDSARRHTRDDRYLEIGELPCQVAQKPDLIGGSRSAATHHETESGLACEAVSADEAMSALRFSRQSEL